MVRLARLRLLEALKILDPSKSSKPARLLGCIHVASPDEKNL